MAGGEISEKTVRRRHHSRQRNLKALCSVKKGNIDQGLKKKIIVSSKLMLCKVIYRNWLNALKKQSV